MVFTKTLNEKRPIIQCDFCFREITNITYTECVECGSDQCLICKAGDRESKIHKRSHKYRIVSKMAEPLFDDNWKIIDVLLLINGSVGFGIENFMDLSVLLSPKTEKEVKDYFYKFFEIKNSTKGETDDLKPFKSNPQSKYFHEYFEKRGDFETEIYSNEYESLLANFSLSSSDTCSEKKLKRYILDSYRYILKYRQIIKRFVIDRGLVDMNYIKIQEGTNRGEVALEYKWLLKYISKNDFNKFVYGLWHEKELEELRNKIGSIGGINEKKLYDISYLLSKHEKQLCVSLCISPYLYIKLKRLALECFEHKKPFRDILLNIFNVSDAKRIDIIYRWFEINGLFSTSNY